MKIKSRAIISAILLIMTLQAPAQDTLCYKTGFPSGISLGFGMGLYSVKDEYISKEKYSGNLPYVNLEWVWFHNKGAYRLEFEYQNSTHISNNNISAEVKHFTFNQDFIYPVGRFQLLSKSVYAYLGPSAQFLIYDIDYNFAQPGTFISPNTFGIIGSLGVNSEFICPVNKKLRIEGLLRSNLLSFSGKEIDEYKYVDESSPALLTFITATKIDFDITVRYFLANRISTSVGHEFDLLRIGKWDPYIAAGNTLIISINFTF